MPSAKKTIGRKRRFIESDDSDSPPSPTLKSPKKKRRRTLQSSQSDEEKTTNNKPKNRTQRKSKKSPNKIKKTPKPLTLTPAKPEPLPDVTPSSSATPTNTNKIKKRTPSKSQSGSAKKRKKECVKSHDIRSFFAAGVSAADYFSKCTTNHNNLKKQITVTNKKQNQPQTNPKAKPKAKTEQNVQDSDDVDMTQTSDIEDTEMKQTSDIEDKENSRDLNTDHKPLKRPKSPKKKQSPPKKKKSPPQKSAENPSIQNTFASLSCDISANHNDNKAQNNLNKNPQKSESNPPSTKATTGRKRKLDEISSTTKAESSESDQKPAKKKAKFYPGFKRTDAPPKHGQTKIPEGRPYCLSGLRFVITGQLPSLTRDECSDLIKQYGGRVTSAVSGMTRYLICGEEAGQSKTEKAKAKQVSIIDEAEFLELLRSLPAGQEPKIPKAKKVKAASRRTSKNKSKNNSVEAAATNNINKGTNNELLVDKYKPQTSRDLIGNNKCIQDLRNFLKRWNEIKYDKQYKKRAVLLSGQPGIGKTSAIHVIANELGFNVLEFNASDTRSKKALRNVVQESLNNNRISDFFSVAPKKGAVAKKKTNKGRNLIVMDEVDGMGGGDRGGITELIGYIAKTLTPIICICNDRNSQKVRSLANHCLDLRFRKPSAHQIKNRLYSIARAEGFQCDLPTITKLAEGTNGDIRQMLHLLQFWSNDKVQTLSFKDINAKLSSINKKDLTMGPWDVVPKLFYPQTTILKGIEYYFVDYSFIPLFIYENYINLKLHKSKAANKFSVDQLQMLCNATDSMASGDIIDNNIRKSQQYSALPYHAILSTVKPAKYVSCIGSISGRISFPQWLGKNSSKRKNSKLCSELALNMNTNTNCVAMDYLMMLKEECVTPLMRGTEDDIEDVVQFMKCYNISRADWDTIHVLGEFNGSNKGRKIVTKVKTKFTKRCSAELGAKINKSTNKKTKVSANDLKIKNEEDDDDYVEDDEDDKGKDDISKDGLIKMKKTKGKKNTKSKKKSTKRKRKK